MKQLSKLLKSVASSRKPAQKVKGKELYSGPKDSGTSHCQGDGGW
ncbi:hypothetical protein ACOB3W_001007 [Vibrio cholerae]|nr:hypothetical protein [Vibrio cholerae]WOQ94857.1 hypothetical protein R4533_17460 [Vibrio cholerae]